MNENEQEPGAQEFHAEDRQEEQELPRDPMRELGENILLINAIEGDETDQRAIKEAHRLLTELQRTTEPSRRGELLTELGQNIGMVNCTDRTDDEAKRAALRILGELQGENPIHETHAA